MDDLAAAGLVERRRGRGTHVIHHVTPKPLRGPLTGLLENVEILTEATDVYLRQFSREAPPKPIRTLFKLDADETLVRAIRIRSRAGTPFGYYTSWTRTDHAEFNEANLATTSRLVLFKRCRIGVAHVDQFLSAVSANALSAMHLKVKPGTALLTAERHSFNAAGDLVDLLNIQYRPDQFRYKMSMNVKNWKSKE
jgi:GntR family transcriptional regulator